MTSDNDKKAAKTKGEDWMSDRTVDVILELTTEITAVKAINASLLEQIEYLRKLVDKLTDKKERAE